MVAALVCGCGVGVPVAVTTMDSRTQAGSSTNVSFNGIKLAGVEIGRLQLTKALGRDDEKKAAARPGGDFEAAVGRGDCRGNDFSVAYKSNTGAGDLGAGGIGDYAADGRSARQKTAQWARNNTGRTHATRKRLEAARKRLEVGMKAPSFPSERESG